MKKIFTISVILLMMFMLGCAKKQATAPDKPATEVAKEEILPQTNDSGNRGLDVDKDKNKNVKTDEAVKGETSTPFTDVYFDYDKSDIKSDAKATLKAASDYMIANTAATISAEGHCDERGTSEYNMALGDKRAKSVKDYLVSLGVPTDKISTFSYGKEAQVCTEHAESCWSKNRRVHFVVTKGGSK
ncbi:MAG: peptidoglycan-associated lipoprotein Pal [Nitrospirae bacterium]|nr:peptidoglycan-associated lipoprotein Pal [Nitrospirota bacterium]